MKKNARSEYVLSTARDHYDDDDGMQVVKEELHAGTMFMPLAAGIGGIYIAIGIRIFGDVCGVVSPRNTYLLKHVVELSTHRVSR